MSFMRTDEILARTDISASIQSGASMSPRHRNLCQHRHVSFSIAPPRPACGHRAGSSAKKRSPLSLQRGAPCVGLRLAMSGNVAGSSCAVRGVSEWPFKHGNRGRTGVII